jgi:hypothetical protein
MDLVLARWASAHFREIWWWSRDHRSHGPLCSQKVLRLGKRALRGSENWGFRVHMHLDTKNAETPIERHKAVVTALGHGICK